MASRGTYQGCRIVCHLAIPTDARWHADSGLRLGPHEPKLSRVAAAHSLSRHEHHVQSQTGRPDWRRMLQWPHCHMGRQEGQPTRYDLTCREVTP